MIPEYICIYWHGNKIPQWRQDCIDRLLCLYPESKKIESYSDVKIGDTVLLSDYWRFEQCAKYENCLWVDNDIWLDKPLELTDRPAMADEYHSWHQSICWSGKNPKVFNVKSYKELYLNAKAGLIDKVKITGTHYMEDINGNKTTRSYK